MALTTNVPSDRFEDLQRDVQDATKFPNATANYQNRIGETITPLPLLQEQINASIQTTGWFAAVGSFDAGGTVTSRNQYLQLITAVGGDVAGGYTWGGTLPKVVAPGSAPATTGGTPTDGTGWVYRGDATLRQDLTNGTADVNGSPASALLKVRTGFVRAEDYGLDSAGLLAAVTAAGVGGTISLGTNNEYSIDRDLTLLDRQTLIGNKSTLKRVNQVVTTTTTAITGGATTSVTVTSASGFAIGQQVAFAQVGVARSALNFDSTLTQKRTITNIVGNVLTLSSAPNYSIGIGGTCFLAFSSVIMGEECEVSGVRFDGNAANWSYNRWEVISELTTAAGKNNQKILSNRFANSPSEAVLPYGDNLTIGDNYYTAVNGNAIHLSGVLTATISGEIGTNGNIDTAVGHADGFISFSNDNANIVITSCIADQFISGVGALNNTDAEVTISNCDFRDMYCFGIEGGAGINKLTIDNVRIDNVPTNVAKKTGSPYYGGIVLIALSGDSVSISDSKVTNVVSTYKSIAASSTSLSGIKCSNNELRGDALFSGLNDFDISNNDFYGAVILGTSTNGKFIENDITLPSISGVCLLLNSSGAYQDVRVAGGAWKNGVYGLSLTTAAASYKNVTFSDIDLINQKTRAISFDAYAGTIEKMVIERCNVSTGADADATYNGVVCSTNSVSIKNNTLSNYLVASSRVGISTAGAASNANSLIAFNELRGNWLHTILPAASSGVNVAYNILKTVDVSNQTGNTMTGNVVIA